MAPSRCSSNIFSVHFIFLSLNWIVPSYMFSIAVITNSTNVVAETGQVCHLADPQVGSPMGWAVSLPVFPKAKIEARGQGKICFSVSQVVGRLNSMGL